MTTKLEQAARALLAKWDAHPYTPWREVGFISGDVANLREALAEQAEQEPVDGLARACNLAGVDYQTFLRIKAYLPIAPVRTKDLTDEEIAQAVGSPLDEVYLADFRAVIAADREKNK